LVLSQFEILPQVNAAYIFVVGQFFGSSGFHDRAFK